MNDPPAPSHWSRLSAFIGRHDRIVLALLLVVYFVLACRSAWYKVFYLDELFTVYTSRAASSAELWNNIRDIPEPNPPVSYLLVNWSTALLGENHLSVRLPSILAFAVLVVCVYWFAARHCGVACAWFSIFFLLANNVTAYAYEARPYALVLAFGALGMVCWQHATERRNTLALVALAASLALALSSHYYAVLLFVPLAAGEMAHSLVRRKIDWSVWAAGALPLMVLVAYLPLVREVKKLAGEFWARAQWTDIELTYGTFLASLATPLVGTLAVLALFPKRSTADDEKSPLPAPGYALHDVVLLVGFLAIPIVAVVLGKYVTGAYTKRYSMPTVIGLSLLFGYCVSRSVGRRAVPIGLILALFGGWALVGSEFRHRRLLATARELAEAHQFLTRHARSSEEVVIGDTFLFTQIVYYWPESRFRPLCVVKAVLPQGQGGGDRPLLGLGRLAHLDVIEYDDFDWPWRGLLVFAPLDWLRTAIQEKGIVLEEVAEHPMGKLYRLR
jgi:4-amino-4-deoxy-L-arabinose transferase-like glycosyltransferase